MKAVTDTGPVIHLSEIGLLKVLRIFKELELPEEVKNELARNRIDIKKIRNAKLINLDAKHKDISKIISEQFSIGMGESEAISLALQEKIRLFLTDDLDARTFARNYDLEVHGSVGIILRAFRDKIITKDEAIKKTNELYENSSLFITKDLVGYIIKSILAAS